MQTGALRLEDVLTEDVQPSLVVRAQAGDTGAFRQLYDDNVGRVFAVCLRIVANHARAEELTQDTFVQAWQTLGSFKGESLFSSWLHRVAVNVVLMNMRSERRRTARVFSSDALEGLSGGSSPQTGTALDLEHAIGRLPPQARTTFVLHDIEGYTHEEIAEHMELAVGTTKAQLHRARTLLKEMLGK